MQRKHPPGHDSKLQEALRHAGTIPGHIAIIMDGNGRWAQQRGLPRIAGHKEGVESVRDIIEACGQLGVNVLTLYAFSTENWKRPKQEVSMLMRLLMRALRDETDKLYKNNVRVFTIGDTASLPKEVRNELADAIEKTRNNTGLRLILALSYSGRWDITHAVLSLAGDLEKGGLKPDQIDDSVVARYLSTNGFPDPDLLIRTSGEFRISNFLLWQLAYSEIYISPVYWPDFRRGELYSAISEYQHRERRFGMVSEQLASHGEKSDQPKPLIKRVSGI